MDLLGWIAGSPVAMAMKGSATLYILVNAGHILSIGLIIGAILPLDLRLIGFFRQTPVAVIGPFLARAAATGVVLAILTGLLLFSVRPTEYAGNPAFLAKIGLLVLGVINAALLHRGRAWRGATSGGQSSTLLRLQAAVSLVIWISAVVAGRWIGFV